MPRNFRLVGGLDDNVPLYRCGDTDKVLECESSSVARQILLQDAGLVIDLRSDSERDETAARAWMEQAGYTVQRDTLSLNSKKNHERIVLRLDLLHPSQFMQYLDENWLSPSEKMQAALDPAALHRMRMRALNTRGLLGLNQAILVTGRRELLAALQAMTLFWEQETAATTRLPRPIVFHCVQGKDRTGLLSMLCQSILLENDPGIDDTIVSDYHRSENFLRRNSGSAAARDAFGEEQKDNGKLDRNFFSGSPKIVMKETLRWIRAEHKSMKGYLGAIGFDQEWRQRYRDAVTMVRQKLHRPRL